MYYTETIGHRWATQSISHPTLERAEHDAQRSSFDCFEVRVYDCEASPCGELVCVYRRGVRYET